MRTSNNIESKAYRLLAEIREKMLSRIIFEAKNHVEYKKDKPEDSQKFMEYISDASKWDYCGLLSKEDKAILEVLEYIVDDNQNDIRKKH